MKAHTKEEKFILGLYDAAMALGNEEEEVSRYEVGKKIGMHPTGIDSLCDRLAQANFIKKRGDVLIVLTQNGLRLHSTLKEEK